jgi:hypothetical protein
MDQEFQLTQQSLGVLFGLTIRNFRHLTNIDG